MNNQRYSPEFKDEAVRQVIERAYTVAEVSANLRISQHSLYKWVKAANPLPSKQKDDELIEAKKKY
jgi:transposase